MGKIIGICVEHEKITDGTSNIYYHVVDNYYTWTWYNEKNVPDTVIELINKSKPVKKYNSELYQTYGTIYYETFVYKFYNTVKKEGLYHV